MTSQEALKRNEKSQHLKVFHLEDSPWFYVESEEGKICYKVCYSNETEYFCNCGDFARGFKYVDVLSITVSIIFTSTNYYIKFSLIYRKAIKKSLTNTNQEEGIHNFRYPSAHRLHPLPTAGNILPPAQYHYARVAPQP